MEAEQEEGLGESAASRGVEGFMWICIYDLMRCKAHYRLVVELTQSIQSSLSVCRDAEAQMGVHRPNIALEPPIFHSGAWRRGSRTMRPAVNLLCRLRYGRRSVAASLGIIHLSNGIELIQYSARRAQGVQTMFLLVMGT